MTRTLRLFGIFLLSVLCTFRPGQSETFRLLMIGNSYTAGTWQTIRDFCNADPDCTLQITVIAPGGQQLHQHEATLSTQQAISTGGPWDYVVLQEQSQIPAYADFQASWWDTFFEQGAKPLATRAAAAGAKVIFFQTWARATGDTSTLPVFGNDPIRMQDALTRSYDRAASELQALSADVGEAWEDALSARPDLPLHVADLSHPNANGAFLTAAVFYERLTGKSAVSNPYTGSLPAADAAFLKQIAHSTAFNRWAEAYNLSNPAPEADPDGDGFTNEQEWEADTDPGNPGETPKVHLQPTPSSGWQLLHPSSLQREYALQSTPDLRTPWSDPVLYQTGNGSTLSHPLPSEPAMAFYRIRIRRPFKP